MEFSKTIALRKSTRAFTARQVEQDDLNFILSAGCAAPVANNQHERIHLTVLQNAELLGKIGRATAKAFGQPGYDPFYGAGTCVVVSVKPREGEPNVEIADGACVMENMLLAATDHGIDNVYVWCLRWGLNAEPSLVRELGVPDGFLPISGAVLGYGEEPPEERPLSVSLSCNPVK